MRISLANLRRRLRNSGVSASDLLKEIRRSNALELLPDQRLSVEEVAEMLGFDAEQGFRKVFERWANKSQDQAGKEMDERKSAKDE